MESDFLKEPDLTSIEGYVDDFGLWLRRCGHSWIGRAAFVDASEPG